MTGSAVTVVTRSKLTLGPGADGVTTVVRAKRMLFVMRRVEVDVVLSASPQ